jgi:pescadillo
VPYKYPPNLPIDVDYRVMSTFLDFYIVLLKFVLYKLYSSQNLQYPPSVKDTTDEPKYEDFELIKNETPQETDDRYKIDQEFVNIKPSNENMLFTHLNFYLSTEVPRYSLEFVVLAAGGTITEDPNSPSITHYITDR